MFWVTCMNYVGLLQSFAFLFLGVGGTIDYLKENKDANKIPDKCVKALDKYLDDALTEDKDKE